MAGLAIVRPLQSLGLWTTILLKTEALTRSNCSLKQDGSQKPLWLTCLGKHVTFLGPQRTASANQGLTDSKSHRREMYSLKCLETAQLKFLRHGLSLHSFLGLPPLYGFVLVIQLGVPLVLRDPRPSLGDQYRQPYTGMGPFLSSSLCYKNRRSKMHIHILEGSPEVQIAPH